MIVFVFKLKKSKTKENGLLNSYYEIQKYNDFIFLYFFYTYRCSQ